MKNVPTADPDGPSWVHHGRGGETQEGDDAAPGVIVGARDKADVFGCDDDHQRPEHQGQEAQKNCWRNARKQSLATTQLRANVPRATGVPETTDRFGKQVFGEP
jgi:hypothetical protein